MLDKLNIINPLYSQLPLDTVKTVRSATFLVDIPWEMSRSRSRKAVTSFAEDEFDQPR